ncbi:MAG: D-alanine--D-alanyl carrier protein ligase [Chroococcidiopsis sp. SAG 2025]|uniref:non-ribosomal peptide synthetase n=1 Tax=Chroococcidiopsis sp. SAG 2025 TaxID=171389 RepID=UPI002936EF12|nr:amino acid adenylation domain-containing protein [Chroococcidiopsis sp. SAG 2025]MDV2992590.1 D-alanine--D-alanyl carrier protein ligase [Chroococcidiopsis sp. SAG 2025]
MNTNPVSNAEFVFPASFAQQRLWFLHALAPGNPFYNISAAIRLHGHLNITALEQTFNEIVRRHEALRTRFEMSEGQLHQLVVESVSVPLAIVDLRTLPTSDREAAARQQAIAQSQHPFDLSADLLLRLTIFQLDASEHILLLNLHHIIADGWSIGVLVRELGTLYTAFSSNKSSPLADLPIQYADFAHWQQEWLQGEVLESQLSYWRSQLADLAVLNLPTDRARSPIQSYKGATHNLQLSKNLTQSLEAFSQQAGVTLFMTLLAAFQMLLHRYTGQEDIAVGSPIANRNRPEIEPLIGFFVNSLVLRTDLSGNPTFWELLGRVREVTLGAYAHQDLPFEKLVEELHPERDLSRHPLFSVAIALQNTPITALELPGLALSQFEFDSGTSRLDLEFHLWQTPAGLQGQIIYSTDLFDRSTIVRMLGHFQTLLEGIVADPNRRLADLPILTAVERQQLLVEWNLTQQDYPSQCIHHLFEAQADKTPNAIAVVYKDEQLTYQELNYRSNQLASYLQTLGVAPEVKVSICVERSFLMMVGILGILKAGGAYVPLDPAYPSERLKFMLEDAQITILLTQQSLAPLLKGGWGDLQPLYLDRDWEIVAQQSGENINSGVTAANLAYIIYTSGSTGQPKGVLVEHGGLCNLAQAQIHTFDLKPEHRILQFASLSFDASIFEIVMAWAVGATLYLVPKAARLGSELISYLKDRAITHATLPPAVLKTLSPTQLPALQTLISAGETCSPEIAARWASDRHFFNAYGLTETTVWSTIAEVSGSKDTTIGRAISNTQIYILDAHLQPQPIGIPGEIYIGGVGLARGYLNRPELTAQRFICQGSREQGAGESNNQLPITHYQLPITNRLYKTGDLARYLIDGNLEYLGRIDRQVKIRGYRIELGEIESLLLQHSAVEEAVVLAQEDRSSNYHLVAYIVPDVETNLSNSKFKLRWKRTKGATQNPKSNDLRCFLKQKLPDYSIPSAFVVLPSLPLTPNGKVDRNALMKSNISSPEHPFVTPKTAIEATLTTLWANILKLEQVGIEDNFFELGGNSLLAVQLLEQVERQFEQKLPLSDLFGAPTVEQFAPLIQKWEKPKHNSKRSPLVPLQPLGSKPPFFCIHPIFGVVLPYYELARHLGTEQPFYGLQPFGMDGLHPPLTSIEEMAAGYIEALRQIQPHGPYQLGGWSFGGLVAYEMAQQLHQAGEQVSFLAILDTIAPISSNRVFWGDGLKFLLTTVPGSIYPFVRDYWSLIRDRLARSRNDSSDRLRTSNPISTMKKILTPRAWLSFLERTTISHLLPQSAVLRMLDELTIHRLMKIFSANSRATLKYTPRPYPQAIALFRTTELQKKSHDPTLGWSQLSRSGVQVHYISGNHLTMLQKPHVRVLAEHLRRYLA